MGDEVVQVGKYTLESLTTGMYADPKIVYREYIQNSVDSLEHAVSLGMLEQQGMRIDIIVNADESYISIKDNGTGIAAAEAAQTLMNVGSSKKRNANNRGFRGIGRLGGMSYCKRLTFTTSYKGEAIATQIIIDASKLSEVLADDSQSDVTVVDVLESVYTTLTKPEKDEEHYFSVQLDGVDTNSRLLSYADVEDYLTQNAPVPYSPDFVWGKEIVKRLQNEGLTISSYNVFLEYGTRVAPLYKPYRDEFIVDKGKNITDTVQDIQIVKIPNDRETLTAIGWLAKTSYKGSIYEKAVKGIRLRKGNILIGDHQTLNVVFKDARFNGWSIGEIFAIDKLLIPNARRDNFEKNPAYFALFEQLMTLAAEITRDIRAASLKRNSLLSNAISQLNETAQQAASAIDQGVSGVQKGLITKKLKEAHAAVSNSTINGDSEQYYQDIAFAELDMLIGKLKGTTKYKALNTIDSLTNTEKKILERVINIVEALDIENSDAVIEAILNNFSAQ